MILIIVLVMTECSNIPNILPNDPKNIDEPFDVITSSKNYNDIAYWPEQLTSTDNDYLITTGPKMSIDYMKNFNFPRDILSKVNLVSKSMQSSKMDIRTAVLLSDNCTKFLQDYRITGHIVEAIKSAEKLALQLNVEPNKK